MGTKYRVSATQPWYMSGIQVPLFWVMFLILNDAFIWLKRWTVGSWYANSNSSCTITSTFGQIPLGKVWAPLSSQQWVKYYHYCSSKRMGLALNSPRRLICHKNKQIETETNAFTEMLKNRFYDNYCMTSNSTAEIISLYKKAYFFFQKEMFPSASRNSNCKHLNRLWLKSVESPKIAANMRKF